MNKVFSKLEGGLIVSCQAQGKSPFNSPLGVSLFAKTAVMSGAVGIRSEGAAKTKAIVRCVRVPVIGLIKSEFPDGTVRITGSIRDVAALVKTGCHIIAIDGTLREREGLSGPEFIALAKKQFKCVIMADISTMEDGLACAKAGADCLSTTLSGYTPQTAKISPHGPDFKLLAGLAAKCKIPVFAEGRIHAPEDAAKAVKLGAWAVVVGAVITKPEVVTSWFVNAIKTRKTNGRS